MPKLFKNKNVRRFEVKVYLSKEMLEDSTPEQIDAMIKDLQTKAEDEAMAKGFVRVQPTKVIRTDPTPFDEVQNTLIHIIVRTIFIGKKKAQEKPQIKEKT